MKALVDIRFVKENEYFNTCTRIADCVFGSGYLTVDDFTGNDAVVLGAFVLNKLVGFCLSFPQKNIGRLSNYLASDAQPIKNLIYIKSMGVLPEYHSSGIAKALLKSTLGHYGSLNGTSYYTDLWKKRESVPAQKIFEQQGFLKLAEVENYWFADSLKRGYFCPECGEPPCRCSTVLYFKSVDN